MRAGLLDYLVRSHIPVLKIFPVSLLAVRCDAWSKFFCLCELITLLITEVVAPWLPHTFDLFYPCQCTLTADSHGPSFALGPLSAVGTSTPLRCSSRRFR